MRCLRCALSPLIVIPTSVSKTFQAPWNERWQTSASSQFLASGHKRTLYSFMKVLSTQVEALKLWNARPGASSSCSLAYGPILFDLSSRSLHVIMYRERACIGCRFSGIKGIFIAFQTFLGRDRLDLTFSFSLSCSRQTGGKRRWKRRP